MNADNAAAALAEDQVSLIVEVFRMLADPTRIRVLWALTEGESSVNDLAEKVDKPAPSVSQHLAKLRMARLVRTRRAGPPSSTAWKTNTSVSWSSMRCSTPSTP